MNSDEHWGSEERLAAALVAWDQILASGIPLPNLSELGVSPELRSQLEPELAYAQMLRQLGSAQGVASAFPMPCAGGAFGKQPEDAGNRSPSLAPLSSPLPTNWGTFQIRRELGRGTYGVVFLAYDPKLGREVALKVPRPEALLTPELRDRFQTEARAAAGLDHPNLVPVYEVGEVASVCYIASAYCPGLTLAQWLKQRAQLVPGKTAAKLVATLADAVHHAHQRGVIHRDLKPSNVLLIMSQDRLPVLGTDNSKEMANDDLLANPRITDFGLAKLLLKQGEPGTQSGHVMGTVEYMSPEQANGKSKEVGPVTDVYALGAILYELLTGRPPFRGETNLDTLDQVRSQEPVPPRRLQPKVPRDLETICLKCLEKEPAKRYASAMALAGDLERWLRGEPICARSVSVWERGLRWVKRRPAVAALVSVSIVAAAVTVIGGLVVWDNKITVRHNKELKGALDNATEAKREVEAEQLKTKAALQGETTARQELDRVAYVNSVGRAYGEWLANNLSQMEYLLDQCPPALRGWEWHYLRRLRNANQLSLHGHEGGLSGLAFSPDGRQLASSGADGTVRLWVLPPPGMASGTILPERTWTGHAGSTLKGSVRCVAFGQTNLVASGGSLDCSVRVWDAMTGQPMFARTNAHGAYVLGVAFSPGGKHLASASHDRGPDGKHCDETVKIWNVATQEVRAFKGHSSGVTAVAFSPDGQLLASSSYNGTIKVWNVASGQELLTPAAHQGAVNGVAFSPDGRRLTSAGTDTTVKIWDVNTGKEILTLLGHDLQVNGVCFSPDGRLIASSSSDLTVRIWDAMSGKPLRIFRGHTQSIWSVDFSPDGRFVATASLDGTGKVWSVTTDQDALTLKGHLDRVTCAALSPDSKHLASASADRTIKIWDGNTGQEIRTLGGHSKDVNHVAFSSDGTCLSASCDKTVKLWNIMTGQELRTLEGHSDAVCYVAVSPNGRYFTSASNDKTVNIWDAKTSQVIFTLEGHKQEVLCVTFSADSKCLASGGKDAAVKIWDVATGQELRTLNGHMAPVKGLAFSPDGRQLASGSEDYTVKVWDVMTGQEIRTQRGHTAAVKGVAFSPDGKRLVSAGWDRALKIWEATSGEEILNLRGHAGVINSVAFSADGNRIVTASDDQSVRIWDGTPERTTQQVASHRDTGR